MRFYIGTSGWTYRHWTGAFYPESLRRDRWLAYYSSVFDTVELNATFYRLPREQAFRNWCDTTPEGFIWSLKASRFITHIRRLKDVDESLEKFYSSMAPLRKKIGAVLFQLPPSLKCDLPLLSDFIARLDSGLRYAVEFRHASWMNDELYEMLRSANIALCVSDSAGRYPCMMERTADFVYMRLHGSTQLYASLYSADELLEWKDRLLVWGKDAFVYFDNDFQGNAALNARQLKKLVEE